MQKSIGHQRPSTQKHKSPRHIRKQKKSIIVKNKASITTINKKKSNFGLSSIHSQKPHTTAPHVVPNITTQFNTFTSTNNNQIQQGETILSKSKSTSVKVQTSQHARFMTKKPSKTHHNILSSQLSPLKSTQNHFHTNSYQNNTIGPLLLDQNVSIIQTNNNQPTTTMIDSTKLSPHFLHNTTIPRNHTFRSTRPTRSVARVAGAVGLVAMFFGARYLARGLTAFYHAFTATDGAFRPPDEEQILQAHDALVMATDEVNMAADQEIKEIEIKKQKDADMRQRWANEARKRSAGLGNNIIQDDLSDHVDTAAREKKKREQEEKDAHVWNFESNDAEIEMNNVFYENEFILRGDGSGFEVAMTSIEAEKILQVHPDVCLEELTERRAVMMRLNHPDLGGSPFLAAKVNEAFDLLKGGAKSDPSWVVKRQKEKEAEEQARKKYAEEILREQLKKEGVLDDDGEVKHPDGGPNKKHDKM